MAGGRPFGMTARVGPTAERASPLRWVLAFFAVLLAVALGLAGAASASAVAVVSTYDAVTYVYDAPARLLTPRAMAETVRGTPAGPSAVSWGSFVLSGRFGVAANTARNVLPTPQVSSTRLQNLVDNLYKGTTNPNRVGNGTTMDAIRSEVATGVTTGGRMHTVKGQETLQGLNNWLRRNPDAPYHDRLVAQSLADELAQVLGGG